MTFKKNFFLVYNFNKFVDFFFDLKNSEFYVLGKFETFSINMPNIFFYLFLNYNINYFGLKFNTIGIFKFFLNNIRNFLKYSSNIFFFRMKLKGLGYRFKNVFNLNFLYKIFFAQSHFFYFFLPKNVLIKKKRKLIFFSNNLLYLNRLLVNFILLNDLCSYKLKGFFRVKSIIFLKPKKSSNF